MKQTVVVEEKDWSTSQYNTREWEQSVEILNWEHDYVKKKYTIVYKEK